MANSETETDMMDSLQGSTSSDAVPRCAKCQKDLPEISHREGKAFHAVCKVCCLHFCLDCTQISPIGAYGMMDTGQSWECEPPCSPFKTQAVRKRGPLSPSCNNESKRRSSLVHSSSGNSLTPPQMVPSQQATAVVVFDAGTVDAFKGVDLNSLFAQLAGVSPNGVLSISLIDQASSVRVRLTSNANCDALLEVKDLVGIEVAATLGQTAKSDTTVRCRVSGVDRSLCEETLRASLASQGVIELARVMYWRDSVQYPTAKVIIVFPSEPVPKLVSIGALDHEVEVLARPMSCRRCLAFDHITSACPHKDLKCSLCGEWGHIRAKCGASTPTCANCAGNHRPWDGRCPIRRRAIKAIVSALPPNAPGNTQSAPVTAASVSTSALSRGSSGPLPGSYSHAVVNGASAQSSTFRVQSSQPQQPSIGNDISAIGASLLASSGFRVQISKMVEQAVATALASTLERAVEGVLVRVLSSYGLIPPQPSQIPIVYGQGTVITSQQAPLQCQPPTLPQQSSGSQQPAQQIHGYALQLNQPQQAQQDSAQQQPSEDHQLQQLIGEGQSPMNSDQQALTQAFIQQVMKDLERS
jgi:hypothetical protein